MESDEDEEEGAAAEAIEACGGAALRRIDVPLLLKGREDRARVAMDEGRGALADDGDSCDSGLADEWGAKEATG